MLGYILGYIHIIIILYNCNLYNKKKVDGELKVEEKKKCQRQKGV